LDTFSSDSTFITREVKVVQSYVSVYIKYGSFPSLWIGDNHVTMS